MILHVNNKKHEVSVEPQCRLIDVLREDLRLTGTKEGCGEGECGACSVIVNGRLVNSCIIPAGQLETDDEVLTIEGVAATALGNKIARSFVDAGAVQCGFCTPGMVMAAYALLKSNKKPKVADIKDAIAGNLCRCTGYKKIITAVRNIPSLDGRGKRGG